MWTVGTLASLAATFFFIIRRFLVQPASNALLIASALTVLSPFFFPAVYDTIFWGQLGTLLTLIIVMDLLVIRGDAQGVLVGLATTIKIFPGFFIIIWFMRRQFRQAFTALATVIATTLVASALWYHSGVAFFQQEFRGGQELGHFSTATTAQASSSIVDLFLHPPFFLGHLSPAGTMVVAAVVAIIGLFAAWGAASRGFEFTALVIGLDISTVCSPIAWNHYLAFLPIMLFLPFEIGWRHWTTKFAYFALAVNTIPWHRWKLAGAIQVLLPKEKLYLSYVAQDATVISMSLVVLVAAIEFWPRIETATLWRRVRRRSVRSSDTAIETSLV
jgi:alpha-1,2-mannosyltransferase